MKLISASFYKRTIHTITFTPRVVLSQTPLRLARSGPVCPGPRSSDHWSGQREEARTSGCSCSAPERTNTGPKDRSQTTASNNMVRKSFTLSPDLFETPAESLSTGFYPKLYLVNEFVSSSSVKSERCVTTSPPSPDSSASTRATCCGS